MNLWIDLDLVEKGWALQRAIEFPLHYWAKVDELRDTVVEVYSQGERSYFVKRPNPIDFVSRRIPHIGSHLTRRLLKTSQNLFRCDGETADTDAGGVVHGVGDGCGHGDEWRFA